MTISLTKVDSTVETIASVLNCKVDPIANTVTIVVDLTSLKLVEAQ